jgi:hypothetical protein
MRTILHAVLALSMVGAACCPATAGPVKHWAALPGREIRTIAFHGEMLAEPDLDVVPGGDGWIYVRGKNRLYRLLGTDGAYVRAASFGWCDDRQAKTVVRYPKPAFACVAKNLIVEMTGDAQYRRVLPTPGWTNPADIYVYDYPFVTSIERTEAGRWWFLYGYAGGLGYSDADGRTRMVRLQGFTPIRGMARLGDDILLALDGCLVARVRNLRVSGTARLCADPSAPRFLRAGDSVWVTGVGSAIERRDTGGRVRRFDFGVSVVDVAYDRRTGLTYILGSEKAGRNLLVTLHANGAQRLTRLPMTGGASVAVDRRGRIWISAPLEHSLVAIAPEGEWG